MAGFYDVGIFTADGTIALWTKGKTAVPAISTTIVEAITPVTLQAGLDYILALAFDTATSTFAAFVTALSSFWQREDGTATIYSAAVQTIPDFALVAPLTLTEALSTSPPAIALRTA